MKLILIEWQKSQYAPMVQGRQIYFTIDSACSCLSSEDGIVITNEPQPGLSSIQEEADTKMIFHCCHQATTHPLSHGVVVRSPDTGVFVLLLYHVRNINHQIFLDTGVGNKRRLIDINQLEKKHGSDTVMQF